MREFPALADFSHAVFDALFYLGKHIMEFLNTREAAKYLNVSYRFLEQKRINGGGPKYVKLGRAVRYSRIVLDAWVDENMKSNTAQY